MNYTPLSLRAIEIKPYGGNENTDGVSYPEKTLDELIAWGTSTYRIRDGYVMLRGWVYDLTPYLKKYLVKDVYDSNVWHETYALHKTHARKLVCMPQRARAIELKEETI